MTTSRLQFYPRSHRYKLDGEWVPGITTIISNGFPKKALQYWSARTVAEYVADNPDGVEQLRALGRGPMVGALKETPWQKRDEAADRGKIVHALAETIGKGQVAETDEIHGPYVEAAVAFLDDFGVEPLIVERPHFHAEHRWAGTPDLIGRVLGLPCEVCGPAGALAVIDWKSGDSGIWPETSIQLAGYANATHYQDENGEDQEALRPHHGVGVWLQPGGYTAYEMPASEWLYSRWRHIRIVADLVGSMKDRDSWMRELRAPIREASA